MRKKKEYLHGTFDFRCEDFLYTIGDMTVKMYVRY